VKRVMVRYMVDPEPAAETVELVRGVYAELHQSRPAGLRYGTLQLEDGVSFVHIAQIMDRFRRRRRLNQRRTLEHEVTTRRQPRVRAHAPGHARSAHTRPGQALTGEKACRRFAQAL
jgi:hypothetical protein